jgi:hypothetical protein
MEDRAIVEDIWIDSFQGTIPRNYGMSFDSITFVKIAPSRAKFDDGESIHARLGSIKHRSGRLPVVRAFDYGVIGWCHWLVVVGSLAAVVGRFWPFPFTEMDWLRSLVSAASCLPTKFIPS